MVLRSGKWAAVYVSATEGARTITFTNCKNSFSISGTKACGGYFGGQYNTSSTSNKSILNFDNCEFNGYVIGSESAGAFVGAKTRFTINFSNGSVNNCTITSVIVVNETNQANEKDATTLTGNAATGELAMQLRNAQKAAGFTNRTDLIGQIIDKPGETVDNAPIFAHPEVFYIDPSESDAFYTNNYTGVDTLVPGNAAYFQTANGSDETHKNVRVLLAIKETDITDAKNLEFKVVFTLKDSTQKTLTVTDASEAIATYYSVYAGNRVVETSNGYVMLAVVVEDVDTTAMELTAANLAVYLKVGENMIYNNDPTIDAPEYAD
ncbi:MAG: hypothetical protein IJZ80_04815 [Clostridia bacterium]|nr:hypothetical protein [Clostridia bacterium]